MLKEAVLLGLADVVSAREKVGDFGADVLGEGFFDWDKVGVEREGANVFNLSADLFGGIEIHSCDCDLLGLAQLGDLLGFRATLHLQILVHANLHGCLRLETSHGYLYKPLSKSSADTFYGDMIVFTSFYNLAKWAFGGSG